MLTIKERIIGDVTILDLRGRVTLGEGTETLRARVKSTIESGRAKIILNVAGVPYVDSAGNGEIVAVYTLVSRSGGRLVMLDPSKRILDLWSITKIRSVFEIFDSERAAVQSFGSVGQTWNCPICHARSPFASNDEHRQQCANCSAELMFDEAQDKSLPRRKVQQISVPTYDGEAIILKTAWPHVISVEGRLDLFAAEAVMETWQAIPRPRKVVIRLSPACRLATVKGLDILADLVQPEIDGGRTAVWRSSPVTVIDGHRDAFPFFTTEREASATLEMAGTFAGQAVFVEVRDRIE